jgi:hypothetical protein
MYSSNHRITYIDELPPLDELENRASRNRDLIEHYQPSTNSTPTRITNSPYASSRTMYGGDPNMRQNPVPIFPSKVNIQEELQEKEKLFEKANQKLPSRLGNGTFVMPSKMGPESQEREFEDYGIDINSFKEQPPHMSYSEDQYVIPDDSFIIYEESNNKRMDRETSSPRRKTRPNQRQQPMRPDWSNQFPSYHVYPHPLPSPPHHSIPHQPPPQMYPQHPHPPPPVPQYYNGHHHNHQQPHICSLISTHLSECPLCARLYVARKQFTHHNKDDDKPRNVNTAIYMIIIIFLIICCVFMFKKMMTTKTTT